VAEYWINQYYLRKWFRTCSPITDTECAFQKLTSTKRLGGIELPAEDLMKRLALAALLLILPLSVLPASADTFNFTSAPDPVAANTPASIQVLSLDNISSGSYTAAITFAGFTLTIHNSLSPENLPGSTATQVIGTNSAGNTVGSSINSGGLTHKFQDIGSTFMTIDNPAANFNQLLSLNDVGQETGYCQTADGSQFAYIYKGGVFMLLSLRSSTSSRVTGNNNNGLVSGFYLANGDADSTGFLVGTNTSTDNVLFTGSAFTRQLGSTIKVKWLDSISIPAPLYAASLI
jgi:hypothetical protein